MLRLCGRTYCCYHVNTNNQIFSSKGLIKRGLEQNGDGPLEKYRRWINENVKMTATNTGLQTNNHGVATYEQIATYKQIKKRLPFLPRKNCRE